MRSAECGGQPALEGVRSVVDILHCDVLPGGSVGVWAGRLRLVLLFAGCMEFGCMICLGMVSLGFG